MSTFFKVMLAMFTGTAIVIVLIVTMPSSVTLRTDNFNGGRINSKEKFISQWNDSKIKKEEAKQAAQANNSNNNIPYGTHVSYKQHEFTDVITGSKTIASSGCGWCSLTSAMAELNPEKCGAMTPRDWLPIMPQSIRGLWAENGMSWSAPQAWVNHINSIGDYGQYVLVTKKESSTSITGEILNIVKTYAGEDDTVVVLSTNAGLFTSAAHIILATDVSDDGMYFNITDSSTRSAGIVAGVSPGITWEQMSSYNFPMNEVSHAGQPYSMKCAWVIKRIS